MLKNPMKRLFFGVRQVLGASALVVPKPLQLKAPTPDAAPVKVRRRKTPNPPVKQSKVRQPVQASIFDPPPAATTKRPQIAPDRKPQNAPARQIDSAPPPIAFSDDEAMSQRVSYFETESQ